MKSTKVFVAGIAYRDLDGNPLTGKFGDQKLADLFSRAGKVITKKITRRDGTEVEVPGANIALQKETRLSRGFGFVEFETEEEAEKAIEIFNGYEWEGRVLTVRFSEPKPEGDAGGRSSGGGYGGGNGGGRDFGGNSGGYSRDRRN
jgi:RNA recognition motif-containing protein